MDKLTLETYTLRNFQIVEQCILQFCESNACMDLPVISSTIKVKVVV